MKPKPEILAKYKRHLGHHFEDAKIKDLISLGTDADRLDNMEVDKYMDLYTKGKMEWP